MGGSSCILTEEWWVDFVAGWVSGAVGVVACQPLDTLLTRFQAVPLANTAAVVPLADAKALVNHHGFRSLWRGSSPMIGAVPVQNALLMGGYGLGKSYSEKQQQQQRTASTSSNNNNDLLPIFVGGSVGGVLQSFLMSPVEWIKVHQQTHAAPASSLSATRTFVRNKYNLWNKGLTATLLRDGIPHGVWFVAYEYCKTQMTTVQGDDDDDNENHHPSKASSTLYKTVTVPVVSGAFAATAAWTVGYPFDIIKTRIQAASAANHHKLGGVYETGVQLVREADGNIVRGLYRGFGWKLVRSIPASMIGFFTYEFVAERLGS